MNCIEYDGNDYELIKKRFKMLSHQTIHSLCEFLKENNTVVIAEDTFDGASGWSGTHFKIGNADLSCNGYCLNNEAVEHFLNGGQNIMWYSQHDPEYKELEKQNN